MILALALAARAEPPAEIVATNEVLVETVVRERRLGAEQKAALEAVLKASDRIGQGLPGISRHPMTPEQCRAGLRASGTTWSDPVAERVCGGPWLRPLYDPATQRPEDARVCIDQFEFPNVPCEYPVVWVRAKEAAELCEAVGERLCDAHEWEGACAGALRGPDYRFDLAASSTPGNAPAVMRAAHNAAEGPSKAWAYGPSWEAGRCGTGSTKAADCDGSDWRRCGSNTYPVGAFPQCVSALGVADQHGNAAEHMNLPLRPDQMASAGSAELGVTEMKGSWFIWDTYRAHEDWCRWRAPFWHGGAVMADDSHRNYHLGFRCCKDVGSEPGPVAPAGPGAPGSPSGTSGSPTGAAARP